MLQLNDLHPFLSCLWPLLKILPASKLSHLRLMGVSAKQMDEMHEILFSLFMSSHADGFTLISIPDN
jgi:hypothetical protein